MTSTSIDDRWRGSHARTDTQSERRGSACPDATPHTAGAKAALLRPEAYPNALDPSKASIDTAWAICKMYFRSHADWDLITAQACTALANRSRRDTDDLVRWLRLCSPLVMSVWRSLCRRRYCQGMTELCFNVSPARSMGVADLHWTQHGVRCTDECRTVGSAQAEATTGLTGERATCVSSPRSYLNDGCSFGLDDRRHSGYRSSSCEWFGMAIALRLHRQHLQRTFGISIISSPAAQMYSAPFRGI